MLSSRERLQKQREAMGGRRAVSLAAGRPVVNHQGIRQGRWADPPSCALCAGSQALYTGGLHFRQKRLVFLLLFVV